MKFLLCILVWFPKSIECSTKSFHDDLLFTTVQCKDKDSSTKGTFSIPLTLLTLGLFHFLYRALFLFASHIIEGKVR